jgi:tyrosyl-tRNA synthetase
MDLETKLRLIKRGTIDIISEKELIEKLKEESPLNIKFGIDPTAPDIHLGHTVPLHKLKQFQNLGHIIHLIIGDYTAIIGDPSGRSETRPMLTKEEISKNFKTYTEQVFKILDPERTNLLYNSDWLSKFSGEDMIRLSSKYTVQQMLQRRDFGKRLDENKPLSIAELVYPLLVGYDSVHLKSDIELGGSDQLFNFMTSRDLQVIHGQKPEVVLILPILEGLDGVKKMSKSLGNAIGVNETPFEMYGKIMSINDQLMLKYYELLSDVSTEALDHIKNVVQTGIENPMVYKKKLAREIVTRYHSSEFANDAELRFSQIYQNRKRPQNLESFTFKYGNNIPITILDLLRESGRVPSNSEGRRLLDQGGVRLNNELIKDPTYVVIPKDELVLEIGKRYLKKVIFDKK